MVSADSTRATLCENPEAGGVSVNVPDELKNNSGPVQFHEASAIWPNARTSPVLPMVAAVVAMPATRPRCAEFVESAAKASSSITTTTYNALIVSPATYSIVEPPVSPGIPCGPCSATVTI